MNPAKKVAESPARRILVVDDSSDTVRSLALLLHTMGHHVDYAINATAAIDTAVTMMPDVIFLDLLLPDNHGSQVCSDMRKRPELKDATMSCANRLHRRPTSALLPAAQADSRWRPTIQTKPAETKCKSAAVL